MKIKDRITFGICLFGCSTAPKLRVFFIRSNFFLGESGEIGESGGIGGIGEWRINQ